MTNFEWLVEEHKDDVKAAMISKAANPDYADGIAIDSISNDPCLCSEIDCENCRFYKKDSSCFDRVNDWLDEEHIDEIKILSHEELHDALMDFMLTEYNITCNNFDSESVVKMEILDKFFDRVRLRGVDD